MKRPKLQDIFAGDEEVVLAILQWCAKRSPFGTMPSESRTPARNANVSTIARGIRL